MFVPVSALSLAVFAATRGFATMRPTVYLDKIARPALQPMLVLLAILAGAGSTVVALAYLGPYLPALVAGLCWMGMLLRRAERRRRGESAPPAPPARSLGRLWGEFWRFTGPRGLAAIFQTTSLWLNTLLIGALRSTKEAGVYAASSRYLAMAAMAAVAIRQVLAPKLSELLARGSTARAAAAYQTTTSWMVALNWPIYLALLTFGPALLQVFGRDFAGGDVVLVVLSATMLVATAVGPVDVVLLMGGRSSWNLVNTVLALGANLALNFALTPRYGLAGAAVAMAVGDPAQQPAPPGPGVVVDGPAPVRAGHRGGRGPVGGQLRAGRAGPAGPGRADRGRVRGLRRARLRAVRGPAVALP